MEHPHSRNVRANHFVQLITGYVSLPQTICWETVPDISADEPRNSMPVTCCSQPNEGFPPKKHIGHDSHLRVGEHFIFSVRKPFSFVGREKTISIAFPAL
jgi:hypothetical protein